MLKKIILSFFCSIFFVYSQLSFAGFFDSDWWNQAIYSVSDPVQVDGGVSQGGTAELYFSNVDANLVSRNQGKFEDNGYDKLTASFKGNGLKIGFDSLSLAQAQQWAEDNANDLIRIVFGSVGRSLAGQDAAHAETNTVMSDFILTPSKGSKQKTKGLSISGLNSRVDGSMSYTSFKNGNFNGDRYGLNLSYIRDLNDKTELTILVPYYNVNNNDSTKTISHVVMPSLGLSYKLNEDEMSEIKVGGNIQATAVYSDSALGNLGYVRYAGTIFGSYRYFMSDSLTLTGGVSLGMGKFYTPDLSDEYAYLEKAFNSLGTDTIAGLGGLIEYEFSEQMGFDFYIYGAHNFNADSFSRDQITFGPQLRYSIYDSFDVNFGYRRTQDFTGDNKYSSDTLLLNARYDF